MAIIRVVETLMDIPAGAEVEVDILGMCQSLLELLKSYLWLTFLLGEMVIILTVVAMEEVVVAATAAATEVATMVAAAMEEVEVEIVCQAWAKG